MRDPNRIDEMLKHLEIVWKKNPDLRLGQIVFNAVSLTRESLNDEVNVFYTEDDKLLTGLQKLGEKS